MAKREACKHCGGGSIDMMTHEENCVMRPHKPFTVNDKADTIYFQRAPDQLRFPFLVVSEYFETPQDAVTDKLRLICDTLNKEP